MGYAIIFFANVAISNPSELIGLRRSLFVFIEMIGAYMKGTFLCRTDQVSLKNQMGLTQIYLFNHLIIST